MTQSDFERMQELIELLNRCRYEYFDLCKIPPTVSNEEYDKLATREQPLLRDMKTIRDLI